MDDKLMFTMWEIIVVLMVVLVLTISVRGIANDTTYWKKYHSTDLALMTDLASSANGDFVINYEIKDLNGNLMTDVLRIQGLKLVVLLKGGAFYLYDESKEKDRFPQSYIFANDRDITITDSELSSDYIVIYKQGNKLSLRTDYVSSVISCPTLDTKGDLLQKYFDVSPVSEYSRAYSSYMSNFLKTTGSGTNKESLFIVNTNENRNVIYYDDSSATKVKSEKMACLLRRQIMKTDSKLRIDMRPYSSMNAEQKQISKTLVESGNSYNYWIYIDVNTKELDSQKISKSLREAIVEYYG